MAGVFRTQFDRLRLVANSSRFLILPHGRYPNVGSRVLGLVARRAVVDWPQCFGHPLLLLETFVDPRQFHGCVYRAANWRELGLTRGFRRIPGGYNNTPEARVCVSITPARAGVVESSRSSLSRSVRSAAYVIIRHPNARFARVLCRYSRSVPAQGRLTHIISLIGHDSTYCDAQKCPRKLYTEPREQISRGE